MKKIYSLVAAVSSLLLVAFALPAEASSVIRTGDSVSIEQDQEILGDFYSLANILNVSGKVTDDMVSIGRKVTVNGTVGADALIAGETVNIHGTIGDDLRIIGGDVTIAEPVSGDVFVMAASVTVLSTASIGGDIIVYAGDVVINGSVGGAVLGRAEQITIDAPIVGGIDVAAQLSLGEKAEVAQGVKYASKDTLSRSPSAKVEGDIVRNDPLKESDEVTAKQLVVVALTVLFASLVWYLIARSIVVKIVERALVPTVRAAATGFITVIAVPVVVGILMVSVLGVLVGAALFVAYAFFILLSLFTMGTVLGQLAVYAYKKKFAPLSPSLVLLGTAAVCLIAFTHIVGALLLGALLILTLGAMVDLILHPSKSK